MILLSAFVLGTIMQTAVPSAVEVPFRIGETAIIVDVTVNAKKVSLMFDSGFSGAVVVSDSINLGKPTGKMALRDFVRETEADTVKIKSLLFGGKKIDSTDMEAVVTGDNDYTFAFGTHCDGIVGFETIQHDVTEINFEHSKFIFHPKTHDITQFQPDNKRTFMARLLPTGHSSLEMSVVAPSGEKMVLALDTGNSFYATTHREVLERTKLWPSARQPLYLRQSGVASGAVDSWSVKLKDVKIFGVPVPVSVWDIIDLPSSSAESDGTVGFEFLKNFNITIDYSRRRIWFEQFTKSVSNDAPGDLGFYAAWSPSQKRAKIVHVTADGPAEKAGVKLGDDVLSIDGIDLANFGYRRFRRMIEGPVDSVGKLVLSRRGQVIRLDLKRIVLVNEP